MPSVLDIIVIACFLYFCSYLWITCVTLCVIGIAMGFTVVPIFPDMLNTARYRHAVYYNNVY